MHFQPRTLTPFILMVAAASPSLQALADSSGTFCFANESAKKGGLYTIEFSNIKGKVQVVAVETNSIPPGPNASNGFTVNTSLTLPAGKRLDVKLFPPEGTAQPPFQADVVLRDGKGVGVPIRLSCQPGSRYPSTWQFVKDSKEEGAKLDVSEKIESPGMGEDKDNKPIFSGFLEFLASTWKDPDHPLPELPEPPPAPPLPAPAKPAAAATPAPAAQAPASPVLPLNHGFNRDYVFSFHNMVGGRRRIFFSRINGAIYHVQRNTDSKIDGYYVPMTGKRLPVRVTPEEQAAVALNPDFLFSCHLALVPPEGKPLSEFSADLVIQDAKGRSLRLTLLIDTTGSNHFVKYKFDSRESQYRFLKTETALPFEIPWEKGWFMGPLTLWTKDFPE